MKQALSHVRGRCLLLCIVKRRISKSYAEMKRMQSQHQGRLRSSYFSPLVVDVQQIEVVQLNHQLGEVYSDSA